MRRALRQKNKETVLKLAAIPWVPGIRPRPRAAGAAYVPHPLAGVMAQNKPANARERHVWTTGNQKI